MSEERLVEIETQLVFQKLTIKDLSDVLYKQQKEIDRLRVICDNLEKQNKEPSAGISENDMPANEKPPHY